MLMCLEQNVYPEYANAKKLASPVNPLTPFGNNTLSHLNVCKLI